MEPLTFADRLLFAAGRAARVFARRSAIRLALRSRQLRLRRWTVAAPSAGMGLEAMPRQLRWPWSGGFVALARAAGVERIEPGRAPQISTTCSAPSAGFHPHHRSDCGLTQGNVCMATYLSDPIRAVVNHLRNAIDTDTARDMANELEGVCDSLADRLSLHSEQLAAIVARATGCVLMPPKLQGDPDQGLRVEAKVERRIVWNLLVKLAAAGFNATAVDDGGERVKCRDPLAAMEAVFAVGEAVLFVKRRGSSEHGVMLVLGNGEDVISDWAYSTGDADGFSAFMDAFDPSENY